MQMLGERKYDSHTLIPVQDLSVVFDYILHVCVRERFVGSVIAQLFYFLACFFLLSMFAYALLLVILVTCCCFFLAYPQKQEDWVCSDRQKECVCELNLRNESLREFGSK